jgi:hypothetical protein
MNTPLSLNRLKRTVGISAHYCRSRGCMWPRCRRHQEEQIRAGQRAVRLGARLGVPGPPRKAEPPHDASCAGNPGGLLEVTDDSGCQWLPLALAGSQRRLPTAITQGGRQPSTIRRTLGHIAE